MKLFDKAVKSLPHSCQKFALHVNNKKIMVTGAILLKILSLKSPFWWCWWWTKKFHIQSFYQSFLSAECIITILCTVIRADLWRKCKVWFKMLQSQDFFIQRTWNFRELMMKMMFLTTSNLMEDGVISEIFFCALILLCLPDNHQIELRKILKTLERAKKFFQWKKLVKWIHCWEELTITGCRARVWLPHEEISQQFG